MEANPDPSGQTVGNKLIVDNTHTYSDLDELIVNHVQAMARKVEELMAHEKFKHGPEDELRKSFLCASLSMLISRYRSLLEELRCCESVQVGIWLHTE